MKLSRYVCCILLTIFFAFAYSQPIIKIVNLQVDKGETYHISIDSKHKPAYKTLHLKNRFVLDIAHAQQGFVTKPAMLTGTPVKQLRTGVQKDHTLRMVFDLHVPCKVSTLLLKPTHSHPYRLTLKFTPLSSSKQFASDTKSKAQPLRDIVVVLDPGHGGRDPGATGPRGTHEKNITLAIGLDVRRDLHKIPGIKVYMTRTRDVYPTLSQRLFLARRVKADVYVSIHADAFKNRSARGATVFALSQGRASSEAARWIAERENKSELLGGIDLADKSYTLRSVLVDLSQTATIGSSLRLGGDVLTNLRSITRLHSYRVEQASLYVLTSPDIPAILIETGFISNRYEEQLLNNRHHQQKIAKAIAEGIRKYLIDNPLQNTVFSARVFGGKYIVKQGNTLSYIAQKFNVSVASLKQVNEIKDNQIYIGQVIRIPAKKA